MCQHSNLQRNSADPAGVNQTAQGLVYGLDQPVARYIWSCALIQAEFVLIDGVKPPLSYWVLFFGRDARFCPPYISRSPAGPLFRNCQCLILAFCQVLGCRGRNSLLERRANKGALRQCGNRAGGRPMLFLFSCATEFPSP